MKKLKFGLIASALAFAVSVLNLILRLIFNIGLGFAVQLLCLTAVVFCGCIVGYVTKRNGSNNE